MASTNPVPKLYMSVIEDVISEVHGLFLNDGVDEQVLKELKTLWENKLMQSKAVEGFHTEMQAAAMQAAQQQHQQHHLQQAQQYAQPAQAQAAPPVMGFWAYRGTPYQPLINQGQLMQVVRGPNGLQYFIQQPQQQVMLQQQMHPGGAHSAQAPGMQHVLAPLRQPQPIIFANRAGIQGSNAQEMPGHAAAQVQPTQQGQSATAPQAPRQPQALQQQQPMQPQQPLQPHQLQQPQQPQQPQQQSPPVFLQLDGAGNNTSSDEDDEEEDYDEDEDDEEEGKDKGEEDKGGQHGQAEEEAPLNSEDDLSDEGPDQFDTEYVVVCQYDKIHRTKNKWKFQLKDGIMNLNGRDYVFSKANGDAEW